ncbi:MAG: response regulator [Chloroflexi bacterium]|nr:response regulator [Chloroflexota bacterium]
MSSPSEWHVLIVDDEPDNLGVLKLVLEFNNARASTTTSGTECLRLLQEELPTFLLVDIQMPEMTGYELLSKIREHDEWRRVPIIAVTAHAMEGDAEQIMRAGFDGYISKPIDVLTLVEDLQTILDTDTGSV